MNISLDLLQTLDAIDRLGSHAAAAQHLHRVPSAITHAIAKAESLLGHPLFERRGRRAVLTEAGRCLLGPDTTRTFIRALENRFNTVQQHPQDTERMDLRRVIDRDILLLVAALRSGDASHFIPTRWR